jgi:hypothetical protein
VSAKPDSQVTDPNKFIAYDKYMDIRGHESTPLYKALDFSGKYNGEQLAEIRLKNTPSTARIDVHDQKGSKFIIVESGTITLAACDGSSTLETLKLTPDDKLIKTIQSWSPVSGTGEIISQEKVEDSKLTEKIRETATKVQDALKEINDKQPNRNSSNDKAERWL